MTPSCTTRRANAHARKLTQEGGAQFNIYGGIKSSERMSQESNDQASNTSSNSKSLVDRRREHCGEKISKTLYYQHKHLYYSYDRQKWELSKKVVGSEMTNSRSRSPDFTFSEDDTEPDDTKPDDTEPNAIKPDDNITTPDHSTNDQPSLEMCLQWPDSKGNSKPSQYYILLLLTYLNYRIRFINGQFLLGR